MDKRRNHNHITSSQVIILGFLLIILVGSLLLTLPFATRDGQGALFTDALFTATSAVCVTGLVLWDTATYWSFFGQCVILLLIQIGGMGIVTVAVSVAAVSGRKIGLMQRSTMQEAISAHHIGGIVRLTKFILKTTVCVEMIGAILLFPIFYEEYGVLKGIWNALFHSVSAFCNAGFDLRGDREPFSSLTGFRSQPYVNIIVMTLIIVGGIGFLTWEDFKKNKWQFHKYRVQSKVILVVTCILIMVSALYFYFFEFTGFAQNERILCSLFQAVTPRTAGFNTVDLGTLSDGGQMITIILMLIGGSPGSTAGGMKTTTVAVFLSSALAVFRHEEQPHFFKRRIPEEAIRTASTIFIMYICMFVFGGILISKMEELPLMSALFETASAIGTVGLSMGITPKLGLVSQFILILLMFLGRVGGLTLIFAAVSGKKMTGAKYPQEKITVG